MSIIIILIRIVSTHHLGPDRHSLQVCQWARYKNKNSVPGKCAREMCPENVPGKQFAHCPFSGQFPIIFRAQNSYSHAEPTALPAVAI
jgi:hypothetical protein